MRKCADSGLKPAGSVKMRCAHQGTATKGRRTLSLASLGFEILATRFRALDVTLTVPVETDARRLASDLGLCVLTGACWNSGGSDVDPLGLSVRRVMLDERTTQYTTDGAFPRGSAPHHGQRPDDAAPQTRHELTTSSSNLFDSLCPGCRRSRVETSLLQLVIADLPNRVCHAAGSHLAAWHTLWGGGAGEHADPFARRRDAAPRVPRGVPATSVGGSRLRRSRPGPSSRSATCWSRPDFDAWSEALARVGNCAHPIRLRGRSETVDTATGEIVVDLQQRAGAARGHPRALRQPSRQRSARPARGCTPRTCST